jgi:hypothetical protein
MDWRELLQSVDVGDLPPIDDPRLVCECSREDYRVLADIRHTDEGLTLRFSEPATHFVIDAATLSKELEQAFHSKHYPARWTEQCEARCTSSQSTLKMLYVRERLAIL